ncbi:MAG: hypothetical protein KC800_04975 [Candidatus Eremiobacteraeota bacterium]|nr:hypothetical protein [Candidatus Eremiobacteraeota bacterium]
MGLGITFCYLFVFVMACVFCCGGALGTSLVMSEILAKTRLTKMHSRVSVLAAFLFWFFLAECYRDVYLSYVLEFEDRFGCTFLAFVFANGGLGCLVATVVTTLALVRRKMDSSDQL